jgi:hypothetical protein
MAGCRRIVSGIEGWRSVNDDWTNDGCVSILVIRTSQTHKENSLSLKNTATETNLEDAFAGESHDV